MHVEAVVGRGKYTINDKVVRTDMSDAGLGKR
jgi:hypothetical protein